MRIILRVTAVALGLVLPAFGQDATMFRGNLQHSGVYEGAGVPKFNKAKWSFHTGGMVISSPAVVEGMAYVGSTDGNFYTVDAGTGKERWKFEVKSRITSSPAVSAGVIYFGAYDGNFYALDSTRGKLRWKFQTGGERRFTAKHLHGVQPAGETAPDPFDCYLSSPAVWNGTVYFGSGDGNVYALDAMSGALRWKFQTGDVVHASPAIADGTVFIGSWDTYFYALDAGTGQQKWRFKTGDDSEIHNQVGIQSSAAVVDGTVYFGCRDSHLYALDEKSGEKKWALSTEGSWVVASPAVRGNKVYVTTSDSSLLMTLNAGSGAIENKMGFDHWYVFSSPAVAGGTLYVGSTQGKVTAVDLATFKVAWSFETQAMKERGREYAKADGSPNADAIYGTDFYDDMVVGVKRIMNMGAVLSSPVVAGNVIYVGSADGNLYALM